ncbi:MAG TPA: DUF3455 domain-containing protein [Thermoleophilaceae bacterium]
MNRFSRHIVASVVALAAALPLAQAALAGPVAPDVPMDIKVPAGNKVFLVGHAVGVQIYSCNAANGGYAWTLVAPRANLYGDNGKLIATHSAGPTWRATDGSAVIGRRDAPPVMVDGTAIPWLRLVAASTSAGDDGDRLAHTTYVQRVATTGGLAPAAATCTASTAGAIEEIPYTADYYFWKAASS